MPELVASTKLFAGAPPPPAPSGDAPYCLML